MSDLLIHRGEWVVVCDGAKALLLENTGNLKSPSLKTVDVLEQKAPPTRQLGTDAPGRGRNSVGTAQGAVEQTDWHDQAEHDFLLQLAKNLDGAIGAGRTKSLIVVAPPRALGMIRSAYSPALRAAVRAEIDKDLVKLPVDEIEKHLTAA
jgi:protein required for attachment to host cells